MLIAEAINMPNVELVRMLISNGAPLTVEYYASGKSTLLDVVSGYLKDKRKSPVDHKKLIESKKILIEVGAK